MKKSMNVLLAMDHSRYAKNAKNFLKELQFPAGTNLYVLNVIDPPQRSVASGIGSTSHPDKQLEHLRRHMFENARQFVKRVQNWFHGENLKLHPVVCEGLAYNEILSAIDQYNIDLAVVGHQGLSGIRR
ncbi:MAG: universal stress protein, partial [Nitrospirota bacterium]|nr:universal stress protein [Nitrospirota bacterium]